MRIFVVDDDASLRVFVKRWLAQMAGHEVLVFDNGTAAVEALAQGAPCLLISDLAFPVRTDRGMRTGDALKLAGFWGDLLSR